MTNQTQRRREYRTHAFVKRAKQAKEERSSFAKVLIGMIIVFIGVILSIFVMADNENFLEKHFGEDSFIFGLVQEQIQ